jgi:hypothetical protein
MIINHTHRPGDPVLLCGIYSVYHAQHRHSHKQLIIATVFPSCRECGNAVRYVEQSVADVGATAELRTSQIVKAADHSPCSQGKPTAMAPSLTKKIMIPKAPRLSAILPIRMSGIDADGHTFDYAAATLNVSRGGALIARLDVPLRVGDVVTLQKGVVRGKFRVQWLGEKNSTRCGQAGLQCLEPAKNVFGIQNFSPPSGVVQNSPIRSR